MQVPRLCAWHVWGSVLALAACTETGPLDLKVPAQGGAMAGAAGDALHAAGGTGSSAGSGGSVVSGGNGGSAGRGSPVAGGGGSGGAAAGAPSGGRAGQVGGSGGALGRGGASAGGRGGVGGGGGDAGADSAGQAGQGSGGTDEIPAGYVKAILGVGYGGIRILSRDGGITWGDRVYAAADGGDDEDLLRAVVYGKGRWLASGWKLVTSDDGLHWTDHGKFHDGIIADEQIIEGLAYANGYFYAGGDGSPSRLYRSEDGLAWAKVGAIGDTVKHTGLTYRAGKFVSYGDSKTSYGSSDGLVWTDMNLDQATYCEGTWKSFDDCFQAYWSEDGYYLVPEWGGEIRRSTTGTSFKTVYTDDQKNTLYQSRAVAEGYVAPE